MKNKALVLGLFAALPAFAQVGGIYQGTTVAGKSDIGDGVACTVDLSGLKQERGAFVIERAQVETSVFSLTESRAGDCTELRGSNYSGGKYGADEHLILQLDSTCSNVLSYDFAGRGNFSGTILYFNCEKLSKE